jgi:hypothetical protein
VPPVAIDTRLYLLPEFRFDVETVAKRHSTVLAFCNEPLIATSPRHLNDAEFFETDLGGECVWIQPPLGKLRDALVHYTRCKDKSPLSTSAFVVAPVSQGQTRGVNRSVERPGSHSPLL